MHDLLQPHVTKVLVCDPRKNLTNSALRRKLYTWIMRWMFLHDEYTKRCSAHAFGAPAEVKAFYDDLIGTGHELGVSMPVMESYAEAVMRFAITGHRNGKMG